MSIADTAASAVAGGGEVANTVSWSVDTFATALPGTGTAASAVVSASSDSQLFGTVFDVMGNGWSLKLQQKEGLCPLRLYIIFA